MRRKNLSIAILGLVAGGGIGNGLERVAHGSVTDFGYHVYRLRFLMADLCDMRHYHWRVSIVSYGILKSVLAKK